jgi:chromosome segregation ATPase
MRGFSYALEPLLTLKTWECDSLGAKLAMLHRDLVRAETEQETAKKSCDDQLLQLRSLLEKRLDTYSYRQQLDQLGRQQAALERCHQALLSLQEQKRVLMAQYGKAQRKAESIVEHKREQLKEHLQAAQNRQQSEDDRAWAARRLWTNLD